MSCVNELASWAERNSLARSLGTMPETAALASQVVVALGDEQARRDWAFLDLRGEFSGRIERDIEKPSRWQLAAGLSYLLPVFVAWVHLLRAFSDYRAAIQDLDVGENINFLAFWTGESGSSWFWTAQGAATQIAALLYVVGVLQLLVHTIEKRRAREVSLLDPLITQATLEFVKSRTITPEELAGVLKIAALDLESGLKQLTNGLSGVEAIIEKILGVTGGLTTSSELIEKSSNALVEAMRPLANFGAVSQQAQTAFVNVAQSLEAAQAAFVDSTSGVFDSLSVLQDSNRIVADAIKGSTERLESVVEISGQVANMGQGAIAEMATLTSRIQDGVRGVGLIVDSIRQTSEALKQVSSRADDPGVQAFAITLTQTTSLINDSVRALELAVQHVSRELSRWSSGLG